MIKSYTGVQSYSCSVVWMCWFGAFLSSIFIFICTIRATWRISQPTGQCLDWTCAASLGVWSNIILKIDVPSLPHNTTVQKYVYLLAIPNCEKTEEKNAVGNSHIERYYWTSLKNKCHNIFGLVLKEVVCQAGLRAEVKSKCSVYRLLRGNEREKEEHECYSCILPGCQGLTILRYLVYFLSEGELLMEIVVSVGLKLEVSGAFLQSLNCYRNRCCFQRTNFAKPNDTKCSP